MRSRWCNKSLHPQILSRTIALVELLSTGLSLVACAVAGAAWLRARALAAAAPPPPNARLDAVEETVARQSRSMIAWTEDAEAILEGIDRKRKQVTSAAARLRNGPGATIDLGLDSQAEAPGDRRAQLHLVEQKLRARGWNP